jgi:hypothetical protein
MPLNRNQLEQELTRVWELVVRGEWDIARQRNLIADLEDAGFLQTAAGVKELLRQSEELHAQQLAAKERLLSDMKTSSRLPPL